MEATKRVFIGGNWKCALSASVAKEFTSSTINSLNVPDSVEVVIAPSFIHIPMVQSILSNDRVQVAAQNLSQLGKGAFTGEISAEQLVELQVNWVILGHSERRHKMGETDKILQEKISQAKASNVKIIFCCGELLEERKESKAVEVVKSQINVLYGRVDDWSQVVIAYEPVWAIGTGKTASPEQAQAVHAVLRAQLAAATPHAERVHILYGGSMNAANAAQVLSQADIDGGLVGGASLKAPDFLSIIAAAL